MNTSYRYNIFRIILFILSTFITVLLVINFIRSVNGVSDTLSFSSLLDWLGNVKSMDLNITGFIWSVDGNWGLFEGFRLLLSSIASVFGVLVWLASNIVNLLYFLVQFVLFVFAGV